MGAQSRRTNPAWGIWEGCLEEERPEPSLGDTLGLSQGDRAGREVQGHGETYNMHTRTLRTARLLGLRF